jgi:DNA-binding GntR family transcriptional regulator
MLTGKIKKYDFKPDVLAEQISRILTDAILEGVLKSGDKLVEAELQKEFGISRSPLREAFRDLEKKGLVVIVPRKGTFVRSITKKDIEENFPVRATLEGLAAKEAFLKMTDRDRADLNDALVQMDRAVRNQDTKLYWEHHLIFHQIFIRASGNSILINTLQTLRMHHIWYRFSYQYYQEDLKKNLSLHEHIFRLFNDPESDPQEVAAVVQQHIEVASETFLAYLEEQK